MEVLNAFATPIWIWSDESLPTGIEKWVDKSIKKIPSTGDTKNPRSSRGGYQSLPQQGRDFEYSDHILEKLKELVNIPLFISNWWINCNEKGDFNTSHTHPRSDFSIVWAITEAKGLSLTHPLPYSRDILPIPAIHAFDLKPGDMVMFPSDVPHHVEPHNTNKRRITISLNISLIPSPQYINNILTFAA